MGHIAAAIADEEYAIVKAIRMIIRDICVGALDTPRQIGADEEIQDAIDTVGGYPPPLRL